MYNFRAFNHLLDDSPLPANEASSPVLVASCLQNGKGGGNITKLRILACNINVHLYTVYKSFKI